jgi:AhpD family alkylhydroperoxidase
MSTVRITYDSFQKTAPAAQAALLALGKTADESGFDKDIVELAKLRVSQINNCAFCLQIHLNVSRKLGIAQEKLDLVATWHSAI